MTDVVSFKKKKKKSELVLRDFTGGSDSKASAYNAGDPGLIPGSGRSPGEGDGKGWQPTPVVLPGKSHGRRNVVGYSPWGCKELDMIEPLCFPFL